MASIGGLFFGAWSLVAAALLAEAAFVAFGPYVGPLRRRVETRVERQFAAEETLQREALVSQMAPTLRCEFERLEALARRVCGAPPWPSPRDAERLLGLGELLDAFVRLAVAHKNGNELLDSVDRAALEYERGELERGAVDAPLDRRRAMRQRASVNAWRVARCDETRERLEIIGHQLATISGTVRLLHEQCASPGDHDHADPMLAAALGRLERNGELLRELSAYGDDELARPPSHATA